MEELELQITFTILQHDHMFFMQRGDIVSGCTAVVALLMGKQLHVANAGDSRCVVSRAGVYTSHHIALTEDLITFAKIVCFTCVSNGTHLELYLMDQISSTVLIRYTAYVGQIILQFVSSNFHYSCISSV